MILITWGLLTLLAFSNAGGDHIKGGGHIKGGDHIKGGSAFSAGIKSVPQALIQQEEAAPAVITKTSVPASVKTAPVEALTKKGAAPYGLKTAQHEVFGKIHRTAELQQAAIQPVAQVPVIQAADGSDPGRVKGLKTVSATVPVVGKTSSIPAAAGTQSIKGIKTVAAATRGKTQFSVSDSQFREPLAKPIVDQTVVTATKTSPSIIPQKTIKSAIQPSTILTQQKISQATTKGGSDVLPEAMQVNLAGIGEVRKVVIPTTLIRNQEINADIKLLNRQLMEKQTEEELKRTLAGIVNADSDMGAITFSEAELNDLSMRVGANAIRPQARPDLQAPQQRRPDEFPGSRPGFVRQRIPDALKPQIISGSAGEKSGFDQRIRYTGTRITTSGVQGSRRRIIPGQVIGGTSDIQGENMKLVLGNTAGNIQPGSPTVAAPKPRVSAQEIPKPQTPAPARRRPQAPALVQPQPGLSTDIVELNRQLMQKQNEEEIKRTFEGIVRTDSNLGAISLSEAELADISRRVGSNAPNAAVPTPQQRRPEQLPKPVVSVAPQRRPAAPGAQQRRPAAVGQGVPVAPKPQIIAGVRSGFDQRIRYTGTRVTTSGVQGSGRRIIPGQVIGGTSAIQGENMQFVLGNTAGNIQPGGPKEAAPKPRVSAQEIPKPQTPAATRRRPQAPAPEKPQPGLSTDIVELNRQLMRKQNEEEIKRTFEGIVGTDSNLGAISLSEAELADISRRVGSSAPNAAVPTSQQRPEQLPKPVAPQRKPAAPGAQQRRPAPLGQGIPVAPKPQIIAGGAGVRSGFDQRIRYTGSRVTTSGVQGSGRRIIPGQVIGGTSAVQGENMQFVLGNTAGNIQPGSPTVAAPKPRVSAQEIPKPQTPAPARRRPQAPSPVQPQPGLSTDIVELNRQLMQKQSEEEIKRTFEGIVRTDSNLGAISLSEAELADISRRVGSSAPNAAVPTPQQRRPEQLPKPVAPQRKPAVPGAQQRRPAPLGQGIPVAPKPQIIAGGAGVRSGFDQRIRYTGSRVTTSGVQGSGRRIIPGQVIGGTSAVQGENMQFVLGNTAGNIQPGSPTVAAPKPRVSAQEIPKPQTPAPARRRPQAPSPVQPQPGLSTDIVELNRQLMQKQSEEEIKRTFEGIVRTDSNLGAISLSEAELADISRRVGSSSPNRAVPTPQQRRTEQLPKPVVSVAPQKRPAAPGAQQRRPSLVGQRIPVAPKPQIISGGAGVRSGFDQRIRYTGTRVTTSGVQGSGRRIIPGQVIGGTSAIQGENIQFVLGNTAGNIQPGSPTEAVPKPRVSAQEIPKPQTPAPTRRRPQAPAPVQPQPGLSTDIVELNRQLMQKQNEEEIKRTFEGIVGTDSNLGAISLSEAELADISRRVGSSASNAAVPTPQQRRPEQLPKPVAPQRRPAAPGAQQRRPAALGQGIPVAPKPQIIAGGAGVRSGFDQRIRYTGTRVTTSGVQGSGRRIIPGQVIGGTSAIQGENMQFVLGNTAGNIQPGFPTVAAPKPRVSAQAIPKPQTPAPARRRPQAPAPVQPQPGLSTDIVELNRQLMQKQSEEEIKRTFEGIVRTDSNLGAISLSEAELADISRRVGSSAPNRAVPTPQQRRREQLPKPVVSFAPQRRPAAPGAQQRRPSPVGQRIPVAPKPQIISGGAGVRSGFDQRIRYTGTRVTTSGVQGSGRRIIPGQVIGGTSAIQGENMQFVLGNTAGNIQPGSPTEAVPKPRVSAQEIPKPQIPAPTRRGPQAPAPVQPQPGLSTDIVELNRQLMQKQNEEEIKRTFEGIVRTDSNLGAISLSEAELADISRRVGSNAPNAAVATPQQRRPEQLPKPVAPQRRPAAPGAQQRRPAAVGQRIPVAPKPQIIGGSVGEVSGFNQRVRYTGARVTTSGVQGSGRRIIPGQLIGGTSSIQGENMQFVLGNTAGNIQPGSPTVAAQKPRVSAQEIPKPQTPAPARRRPQAPAPVQPQPGLSTDIVELNRQLMQKQNEEEIKRTFEGIVGTDSNLGAISLSEAELTDISRRVGSSAPNAAVPTPQQRRPEQLPKPVSPQRRPAAPRAQQRRPAAVGQRIPFAPKPQIIGGSVGEVSGFNQRVRYTGARVTTSGVQGSGRRIIPGQVIGETSDIQGENMQFVLGNAAGNIQPGSPTVAAPTPRVSAQATPKPQITAPVLGRPQAPAPVLPQSGLSTDIVELNRQLMQKQNEEELRQALSGVIKADTDFNKISLSSVELSEISRSLSGQVSGPSSSESVIPVPYLGGAIEGQRIPSSSSRDASFQRYGSGVRGSKLTGSRTYSQSALNAASKKQIMTQVQQKVGQESIESPLELQQKIESTLAVAQVEEPVVQSKVTQTVKAFNSPISQSVQKVLDTRDSSQLQMKFDDIIEQSQLSKPAVIEQMQLPSRKSKMALDNLSQKYLQEKLPVEIPSYVPHPSFMSPFNYRVPHLRSPIMQQQERLDQILM